jgi:hypothetical protein
MTKKKNSLNKNTSIIVKFIDCTDDEIDESLKSINLSGVRVSNLINRWAIEVPFWKEQYHTEQLKKLDLIDTVHTSLNSAANRYYRKEEVVDDEN